MCLAISKNLLLVLWDVPKRISSTNSRSSGQPKNDAKTLSPVTFATVGSTSIVIHSVKQRLFRNRPEVTLRLLATSCEKDYKGHSLVQTSLTEPSNSDDTPTPTPIPSPAPCLPQLFFLFLFFSFFFFLFLFSFLFNFLKSIHISNIRLISQLSS